MDARITFVIDGPLAQPTGGYVYDRLLIDGLRARGSLVSLVHLAPGGAARTVLENARAAALLARGRDDITVIDELCHSRVVLASALSRWGRAARPRRLVALVHHLAASERSGARAAARLAVERVLLDAADRAVVTSATTRAVLVRAGIAPARIHVVRPGRDRLGERSSPPDPSPDGRTRFLFLGSLTPRKGVLELVDAFGGVAGSATLTLAGPADRDPAYAAAVRLAAAHAGADVRITGTLEDAALAGELARHDALVLPSHYEGFGIAVAEALSHGLAVIASRAGALPEVVRDGAEAILVPPGDRRALMGALALLTRDRARLAGMAENALARARELPTWADTQSEFAAAIGVS
jgi:glycosyltransferase involved in cell wall biosynthesis